MLGRIFSYAGSALALHPALRSILRLGGGSMKVRVFGASLLLPLLGLGHSLFSALRVRAYAIAGASGPLIAMVVAFLAVAWQMYNSHSLVTAPIVAPVTIHGVGLLVITASSLLSVTLLCAALLRNLPAKSSAKLATPTDPSLLSRFSWLVGLVPVFGLLVVLRRQAPLHRGLALLCASMTNVLPLWVLHRIWAWQFMWYSLAIVLASALSLLVVTSLWASIAVMLYRTAESCESLSSAPRCPVALTPWAASGFLLPGAGTLLALRGCSARDVVVASIGNVVLAITLLAALIARIPQASAGGISGFSGAADTVFCGLLLWLLVAALKLLANASEPETVAPPPGRFALHCLVGAAVNLVCPVLGLLPSVSIAYDLGAMLMVSFVVMAGTPVSLLWIALSTGFNRAQMATVAVTFATIVFQGCMLIAAAWSMGRHVGSSQAETKSTSLSQQLLPLGQAREE
jgi:hypothetical protein